MIRRRPQLLPTRSHVTGLRPIPASIYDWEAELDGPLTTLDLDVVFAHLDQAPERFVRDAGRKLRRHLATPLRAVS